MRKCIQNCLNKFGSALMKKRVFKPWVQLILFILLIMLWAGDTNDMSVFISSKLLGVAVAMLLFRFSHAYYE